MNFVIIREFCSNLIYQIVMIMKKFGVCSLDYEKIKGITTKSYSQKTLNSLDSVDFVDSVEDPVTVSEVLGTTSLAGEEAVAVTVLFDFFLKFCLSFSFSCSSNLCFSLANCSSLFLFFSLISQCQFLCFLSAALDPINWLHP